MLCKRCFLGFFAAGLLSVLAALSGCAGKSSPKPPASASVSSAAESSRTNAFTVTFETNGGSAASPVTVKEGEKLTLPQSPSRLGYIFDNWYSDSALTKPFDPSAPITANVTLYAGWFSETLDEDGDGVILAVELRYGSSDSSSDTDGDGVPDYIEIFEARSDPAVPDGDIDSDGDGIPNYDEANVYGTHCGKADTDDDGLSDYEEIFDKKTDPFDPDTDFDGIPDGAMKSEDGSFFTPDPDPLDNTQRGALIDPYYEVFSDAPYTIDFRNIGVYSKENALASLVFANTVYAGSGFSYENGAEITDISELLRYHGFEHIIDYELAEGFENGELSIAAFDDDDISEAAVGIKTLKDGEKTKRIVAVVIRGTDGSLKEWSSNLDMGDPEEWENPSHKGFYITSKRVFDFLTAYTDVYNVYDCSDVLFWITGHSRGAAIAELLAAELIDDGKNAAAYTFASPAVTSDSNSEAEKYSTIYNFVNAVDTVTYLPLPQWGFRRFGTTREYDLSDGHVREFWENRANIECRTLEKYVLTALAGTIFEHDGSVEEFYAIDEKRQLISEKQYSLISDEAMRLCEISEITDFPDIAFGAYYLYPSTAFVFRLALETAIGDETRSANAKKLLREFWNTGYASTALGFVFGTDSVFSGLTGGEDYGEEMMNAHALPAYYAMIAVNES